MLILAYLISCNTTKYVGENADLLKESSIYVNEKIDRKSGLDKYLHQKTNLSVLGVPFSLHFYNLGNPGFEKTFGEWSVNHPKKYNNYARVFSKKQTHIIYGTYNSFNNWFMNKGQEPIIYNEIKAKKSLKTLKEYYKSKGYFEVVANFEKYQIKEKEIGVKYHITTNQQYYIDTLSTDITSPVIDSIYQLHKNKSILKKGNPFVFNDFEQEENRLINLFRNSGIYHFKGGSMGFWTDSIQGNYKKNVVLKIPERVVYEKDSMYQKPYKVQNVTRINVFTDFNVRNKDQKPTDSIQYKGYNFYSSGKLKYKPKHLLNSLFITPNSYFKDLERSLTRSHLRRLNSFSSNTDIKYIENKDESLTANIYLTPLKKYALTFDLDATHSNIKPFGILGKSSLLGRNIFKGSEILEISFQGSFLNVSNDASDNSNFFNAWELATGASLKFPRILFPVNTNNVIPKYMSPQTVMSLTTGYQKNIGLDRQTTTTAMGYTWKSSKKVGHKFELFNLQYIKNRNIENYFVIYDSEYQKLNAVANDVFDQSLPENTKSNNQEIIDFMDFFLDPDNDYQDTHPDDYNTVSDVDERRNILIEDVMVPVVSYSFVYNTRKNIKDNDFSFFRARFVSAGTFSTMVAPNENELGQKLMFGLPIAQYIKVELEYKKYWELRKENILVFRAFAGIAKPFNNSTNIPFSRSYSAGGSNEIRAWRTFDLGPGGEANNLEYKVGTFKIINNLEYRFKVTDKIYSALFVDAGNIWDITDSDLITDEGKFTSFSSLKNTAVGSGIGLRYDFGFLVFRFDVGFKTYEPYLNRNNKWFVHYNFGNAVYNIGINYPF